MIMRAEGGYKITQEEVREKVMNTMQKGTLRDFNQDYWAKFIKNETLDKEALVKAGYDGPGEANAIEAKMKQLGWLPGAKKVVQFAADPAYSGNEPPLSERKQAERDKANKESEGESVSEPATVAVEPERGRGRRAKE